MLSIEISEEVSTPSDMAELLGRIAALLEEGFTSGFGPNWTLNGEEKPIQEADQVEEDFVRTGNGPFIL